MARAKLVAISSTTFSGNKAKVCLFLHSLVQDRNNLLLRGRRCLFLQIKGGAFSTTHGREGCASLQEGKLIALLVSSCTFQNNQVTGPEVSSGLNCV